MRDFRKKKIIPHTITHKHFSFGYKIKYLLLLVHRDIHHENNPVDHLLSAITRQLCWCEWPKSNLCCHWTELPKELVLHLNMVKNDGWIQLINGKLPSEEKHNKKPWLLSKHLFHSCLLEKIYTSSPDFWILYKQGQSYEVCPPSASPQYNSLLHAISLLNTSLFLKHHQRQPNSSTPLAQR